VERARFPQPVQISPTLLSHRPDAGERHAEPERRRGTLGRAKRSRETPAKPRRERMQDPKAEQAKTGAKDFYDCNLISLDYNE